MTTAGDALRSALATLAETLSAAPLPAFDVHVQDGETSAVLRGRVLTFGQAEAVARLAREHGADAEVEVVADPRARLELGWVEAADRDGVLELWRVPDRCGHDDARQTEYVAADGALRVLGRLPGFALLQGRDLAMGWAPDGAVREVDTRIARSQWGRVHRAREGDSVRPARGGVTQNPRAQDSAALLRDARARLDAPYRWGGTTPRGYDCSGLVQRVLLDVAGVLLPRHTSDQRRVGARVSAGERRAGDLLFATPEGQRVGHVMLLTSRDTVLHACRTEHRVIEETLDANARRYRHQGYRRPVLIDG